MSILRVSVTTNRLDRIGFVDLAPVQGNFGEGVVVVDCSSSIALRCCLPPVQGRFSAATAFITYGRILERRTDVSLH
jgi:hypothetical protein